MQQYVELALVGGDQPCVADAVAKRPRLPHETRRLSRDHNDGAKATWDANDAIDAIAATTSRSSSLRGRSGERAEDERRSSGYTCGVVALAVRVNELSDGRRGALHVLCVCRRPSTRRTPMAQVSYRSQERRACELLP